MEMALSSMIREIFIASSAYLDVCENFIEKFFFFFFWVGLNSIANVNWKIETMFNPSNTTQNLEIRKLRYKLVWKWMEYRNKWKIREINY